MTELLERALEAVKKLPAEAQDDIARLVLQFAGVADREPVALSPEERSAIARSKAAADRGEFATDEQVAAVWRKYGL
jgi:predicted transcriptional regulator